MAVPLHIRAVSKSFGSLRALDGVSLEIEPGELFFLLGPSGCGKTTLLRSIAGFCEPDAGAVILGGHDITRLPPHRRDTGMVFQSYALWPHLSVRQNVSFGLEMRRISAGETAMRTAEALELVHMTDKADSRPNELSGGQQQRVALARALVVRPQCLLLDEPLSNLDARLRLEMRGEIRRICKNRGLTAVYVTHDQKEALSIADRLAVLNKGRIEQIGAPHEVYLHPCSKFVAGFIGETNMLWGKACGGGDGEIDVDTSLGRMRGRVSGPAVVAGDVVTVSLRPEAVRLAPADDVTVNRCAGRLHDTVYLGEVAQHRLTPMLQDGSTGPELTVFELNPRVVARTGVLPVTFAVLPADVVVLKN